MARREYYLIPRPRSRDKVVEFQLPPKTRYQLQSPLQPQTRYVRINQNGYYVPFSAIHGKRTNPPVLPNKRQRLIQKQNASRRPRLKMAGGTGFEVVYLGNAMLSLSGGSTGLGAIQKPLMELYVNYQASGTNRIDRRHIDVNMQGVVMTYQEGPSGPVVNESFPVTAMQYCDAVRFSIVKSHDKKLKSAFEPIDPQLNMTNMHLGKLYVPLDKKRIFLSKKEHPCLFTCVLRRVTGMRALDCHAFICKSEHDAINVSRNINYIIKHFEDEDDTGVFKYNPYESNIRQLDASNSHNNSGNNRSSAPVRHRDDVTSNPRRDIAALNDPRPMVTNEDLKHYFKRNSKKQVAKPTSNENNWDNSTEITAGDIWKPSPEESSREISAEDIWRPVDHSKENRNFENNDLNFQAVLGEMGGKQSTGHLNGRSNSAMSNQMDSRVTDGYYGHHQQYGQAHQRPQTAMNENKQWNKTGELHNYLPQERPKTSPPRSDQRPALNQIFMPDRSDGNQHSITQERPFREPVPHSPDRPIAKVPPHKIQGIKVLPSPALVRKDGTSVLANVQTSRDDINAVVSRQAPQNNRQDSETRHAHNRRHTSYEGNWQFGTKLPEFDFHGVPKEGTSSARSGSDGYDRNIKDEEMASMFSNIRLENSSSNLRSYGAVNDFENSLGYLP